MQHYTVPDMTCSHCTATIEQALRALDPYAQVLFDVPGRTVSIETIADGASVVEAMGVAGYESERTPA
jgi:copper chaperone